MPKITFHPLNKTVDVETGTSVLEAAHAHDIPLEGACEGSLACSTCHVIVAPEWFHKLEPASDEEDDMLDRAFGLTATSRLGCQLIVTSDLDGLEVTIPEYSINIHVDQKGNQP
jgi:2Fe-2S ferredoxin